MVYQIAIREILERVVEVEADTVEEALSKAENDYCNYKINLNGDDCKRFEIEECKG